MKKRDKTVRKMIEKLLGAPRAKINSEVDVPVYKNKYGNYEFCYTAFKEEEVRHIDIILGDNVIIKSFDNIPLESGDTFTFTIPKGYLL